MIDSMHFSIRPGGSGNRFILEFDGKTRSKGVIKDAKTKKSAKDKNARIVQTPVH